MISASTPAASASDGARSRRRRSRSTPFISSASATTSPSKPSSLAQQAAAATRGFSVAGASPSAGTRTCAVMIDCTPAAIAARNGCSPSSTSPSTRRQLEVRVLRRSRRGRGSASRTRRRRRPACPRTNAATWRATSSAGRRRTSARRSRGSRVDVHVGDGREVELTPTAASSARDRRRDRLGQRDVVDDAERRVARDTSCRVRHSSRVTSPPSSSIAISRSPRSARSDARQRRRAARGRDVVREQAIPPPPALGDEAPDPVGRVGAGEARQHARRREPLQLARHPRTAPAVSPKAIRRWTIRKKITTGIAVSVDAGHQRRPSRCRGSCRGSTRARPSPSASTGRSGGCTRRCTRSRPG